MYCRATTISGSRKSHFQSICASLSGITFPKLFQNREKVAPDWVKQFNISFVTSYCWSDYGRSYHTFPTYVAISNRIMRANKVDSCSERSRVWSGWSFGSTSRFFRSNQYAFIPVDSAQEVLHVVERNNKRMFFNFSARRRDAVNEGEVSNAGCLLELFYINFTHK